MWQLELLRRVVPALAALAKEFIDGDPQCTKLSRDADDCYSDIVNIGYALSMSRGQWASGLQDEKITGLLAALDTRLPTRWMLSAFGTAYAVCLVIPPGAYRLLRDLPSSRLPLRGKTTVDNFKC